MRSKMVRRKTDAQAKTLENIKKENKISRSTQSFVTFKGVKDVVKLTSDKGVFYVAADGSLLERRRIEESERREFEEFWQRVYEAQERAMQRIREDPFVKKYMTNETKCLKCGNTVFQVERLSPEQVMLTCKNCGEPHLIDVQLDEDRAVLTFWSSKMYE